MKWFTGKRIAEQILDRKVKGLRRSFWLHGGVLGVLVVLLTPVAVSAQTLERIKSAGVINLGYVGDAPPFSSQGSDSQPLGYSIELCQNVVDAVKAKLGLANLAVNYTKTSVEDGLRQVASGSIDLLCGSTTDTLKRRETVSFSIPMYNGGIGVVVREKAPSALVRTLEGREAPTSPVWRATIRKGYTLAVHRGTVTEQWVRQRIVAIGADVNIVDVETHADGVKLVEAGTADAYFADRAILLTYAQQDKGLKVLERYFTFEPIALAMARDDDFRLVVDTALSNLFRSDGFNALYSKYFGEPGEVTLMLFRAYSRQ